MLTLINDFIDCGNMKLSRMKFKFGLKDVRDIIKDSIKLFSVWAAAKNVELVPHVHPQGEYFINTDAVRLF